ncbi:MAG: ABC transporter ATP-binding protein/permease [Lactobacillales bacterium]|jgi:ABC-type bacteriocin/lantibiotic exporter with double-glycine peptidase domain|nr:ABC transporter ATP-binding protein/permease [Lactobacillales bacterium]
MYKYLLKMKWIIVIDFIMCIISEFAIAGLPYFTKTLFEGKFVFSLIGYFVAVLTILVASYATNIFGWIYAVRFSRALKSDFFKALLNLKFHEFAERPASHYLAFSSNDVEALEKDYVPPFLDLFKQGIAFVIYASVMAVAMDWKIGTVLIVSAVVSLIIPHLIGKNVAKKRSTYMDRQKDYFAKLADLFEGFSLVTQETKAQFDADQKVSLNELLKRYWLYGRRKSIALVINGLAFYIPQVTLFLYVGISLMHHTISVPVAVASFGFVELFTGALNSLLYDITTLNSIRGIKKGVLDFINKPVVEREPLVEINERIELVNVKRTLGELEVDIPSLTFEKGKKYAIVGENGSGKSTLLKLLANYESLDSGQILIDGVDRTTSMRDELSVADQRPHVFDAGYDDNISIFGSYGANDEIVKSVGMDALKEKDTLAEISGGEKQVISLQRAINEDKEVLILDEPFSAVDTGKTGQLYDFLAGLNKTLIMVTHQIDETLDMFDYIVTIDNGRVKSVQTYYEYVA